MVYIRDAFNGESICHTLRAPYPALPAHRGIVVEIVQKDEALCQSVLVRGNLPPVDGQKGVPITPGQVAENLIVAAVFLYDVNHMLNLARFDADAGQNSIGRTPHCRRVLVVPDHLSSRLSKCWYGLCQVDSGDVPRNGIQNIARTRRPHPLWDWAAEIDC